MSHVHPRSVLGLLFALPLAALLLGVYACLPVPVGDPEKSKIDQKLIGGWLATDIVQPGGDALYVVHPWDAHTYLVRQFSFQDKDTGLEPTNTAAYKGWLTEIAGQTFITLEPMDVETPLALRDPDDKRFWIVGKMSIRDDRVNFQMIKPDFAPLKEVASREKAEAIIKENIANKAMYADDLEFRKPTKAQQDHIKEVLDLFKARQK